jgi:hypothetical protein
MPAPLIVWTRPITAAMPKAMSEILPLPGKPMGTANLFGLSNNSRGKYFILRGYTVLFDLLKITPYSLAVEEIYYKFESRKAGMSKINVKVMTEYLKGCFL